MKPVKVLQMIDRPFLGGGQMALLSLAGGLDKNKFQIFAASAEGGPLVDELKRRGVPHIPVNLGKMSGPAAVAAIVSVFKEVEPEILHTHGGVAGFYGRWAARKAGTPVVVHTLHGIHYLHYQNALLKQAFIFLERRFSRISRAVIFVSEADLAQAERLRLAPSSKARLIRNGMEPLTITTFDAEATREGLGAAGKPLVAAVSRLHRQKGVIDLLRAVPFIRTAVPDVKIVVAGGGPLKKKLTGELRRLGIEENAVLLGERTDARRIMAAADVFVLPSLWEGLPYVLIEAAAAERPIVATAVDGVREVIRHGETGLLVPPKDPENLARAVIRLLQDKAAAGKLAARAKQEIPPQFTIERMIQETERLYRELLEKKD